MPNLFGKVCKESYLFSFRGLQTTEQMLTLECVATVVRACVPKMILDDVFEQKDDIAKAVSQELEKVILFPWALIMIYCIMLQVDENGKRYPSYIMVAVDFITLSVTVGFANIGCLLLIVNL